MSIETSKLEMEKRKPKKDKTEYPKRCGTPARGISFIIRILEGEERGDKRKSLK